MAKSHASFPIINPLHTIKSIIQNLKIQYFPKPPMLILLKSHEDTIGVEIMADILILDPTALNMSLLRNGFGNVYII